MWRWSIAASRTIPTCSWMRNASPRCSPAGPGNSASVSATPNAALKAEWEEHGIAGHVRAICGQEEGTKKEILAVSTQYGANKCLMIGDAPGDHKAAVANNCLYYPINPGNEEASWKRLLHEGIERFFAGTYAGEFQQELIDEFNQYLPAKPSWPVDAN